MSSASPTPGAAPEECQKSFSSEGRTRTKPNLPLRAMTDSRRPTWSPAAPGTPCYAGRGRERVGRERVGRAHGEGGGAGTCTGRGTARDRGRGMGMGRGRGRGRGAEEGRNSVVVSRR